MFGKLNVLLICHPRLAKYQYTIFIRTTNNLIRNILGDWFREIDTSNFGGKRLVQGNKFNRHFRMEVDEGVWGVLFGDRLWGNREACGLESLSDGKNSSGEMCLGSLGIQLRTAEAQPIRWLSPPSTIAKPYLSHVSMDLEIDYQ